MAKLRACVSCLSWIPAPSDAWCGNCGAPCAVLTLRIEPSVLQLGNIAPPLRVTLTNFSCADLTVERPELPDWIALPEAPVTLAAGASVTFAGNAKPRSLRAPESVLVRLVTPAGNAEARLMVIPELPTLTSLPVGIEVWGDLPLEVPVTLAPPVGALLLHAVRPGTVGSFKILSGPFPSTLVTSEAPLTLLLELTPARFRSHSAASLVVTFEGPHGPRELETPLRIDLRQPPQLSWLGEHEPPAQLFASVGERLELLIANQSADGRDGGGRNAQLVLREVHLDPPPGFPHLAVRLRNTLPLTIVGGDTKALTFDLDLSPLPPASASVSFHLRIVTNGPTLDRPLPLNVRSLPIFDGVLAIDFGSSNTCAAIVETGREYAHLPLDGKHDVSPTLVRYLSLAGSTPEVETGARVKALAATDDRIAASTIEALKQRLGDVDQAIPVRPSDASEWTSRTATAAAADYLREIRRLGELSQRSLFRDFILTHPAVCSLRQYRNLHLALQQAFGDVAVSGQSQIRFLQEPIAALIPLLASFASEPGSRKYTIASFDLGGGTTDLAIVRVENTPVPPDRMEIHPAILYSRGVRFGGEDLTSFLVEAMRERVEELLTSSKPGARLIRQDLPGVSKEDVLRNRYALRQAAEQFKASLSEEGANPAPIQLRLRILPPGSPIAEFQDVPFAAVRVHARGDLQVFFLEELRTRVRAIAELLVAAQKQTGPLDFLQISGKTAFLPEVKKTLQVLFPAAKVVRAQDPKECVVTGACLTRTLGRGARRRLVLPDAGQRTTSSIGLYDVGDRRFTTLLPSDTPIPANGLIGQCPAAWYGFDRIALFENLGVSEEELLRNGSRALSSLGTWKPSEFSPAAEAYGWTLQLVLKDFNLTVSALGPEGEVILFHRLPDAGELAGGAL